MLRLELPDDMRCVDAASSFVANLATKYGVAADKEDMVRFMVEATLELRVQELAEVDSTVMMELDERVSYFVISIIDKGLPYVIGPYYREVFRRGGLGHMVFEQLGSEGQRLTFLIDQERDYVMPEPPARIEETLRDREITCRRTRPSPEDTLEAIRCLYEVYRFEYLHQELYRTDQFVKLLRSGKYVSMLAENAHHQVLGHIALRENEWFPGIREVCNLVVKPMARGLGLAAMLNRELLDLATSEDVGNLYAMPVLHHPISQKLMNGTEFVACGLHANIMDMSKIEGFEDDEGKCSVALCFRKVGHAARQVLYLPDECAGFVKEIYDAAGLPFEHAAEGDYAHEISIIAHSVDTANRSVSAKIDAIGPDLYDRLDAVRFDLDGISPDGTDLDMVIVYLNARDPKAPECYRFLREQGCVFTGCLPGGAAGDYLVLQHLGGHPFDRAPLKLLPNYEDLLDRLHEVSGI